MEAKVYVVTKVATEGGTEVYIHNKAFSSLDAAIKYYDEFVNDDVDEMDESWDYDEDTDEYSYISYDTENIECSTAIKITTLKIDE